MLHLLLSVDELLPHLSQRVDVNTLLISDDGNEIVALAVLVHHDVFLPIAKRLTVLWIRQQQEAHSLTLKGLLAVNKELLNSKLHSACG